jgi:O-methyltransferase involved in polyketide biosynthesis
MDREPLVRDISDTALWVAYYRAQETDRPDALFHDPFARALAGERGQKISLLPEPRKPSLQRPWSAVIQLEKAEQEDRRSGDQERVAEATVIGSVASA